MLTRTQFAVSLLIIACVVFIYLPYAQQTRELGTPAPDCFYSLRQAAFALQRYQEDHGVLPPLCAFDDTGAPTHSWRVFISRYIERFDVADNYDFELPWNSPANLQLVDYAPRAYQCSTCLLPGSWNETAVFAVTGPATVWESDPSFPLQDYPGRTILLIGLPKAGIHWTEPIDFHQSDPLPKPIHDEGHPVAFTDGSVWFLTSEEIRNLLKGDTAN